MFPLHSKRWMMVAAIGQGVLFSLAFRGAVSLVCALLGTPLSAQAGNYLFTFSSLITGAICAYSYARFVKQADQYPTAAATRSEPE